MANTIVSDVNAKEVWETKFTEEFVRQSGFLPYMGESEDSVIRIRARLMSEGGSLIHIPMVPKLSGAGVTGSTALKGSEEKLSNYSYAIRTALARNGVSVPRSESYKSEINLLDAGKSALRNWAASRLRDKLIAQLQSVVIKAAAGTDGEPGEDTNVVWASATEAQKDAYLDNNSDRVQFGSNRALATTAPAGGATNDMSATLATVASTDKLTAAMIGIARRKAKKTTTTSVAINPVMVDASAGKEHFILFCDSNMFRDLEADLQTINLNGRPRDADKNPVFQSGDLLVNGVVVREITELPTLGTVGASSAVVGTAFLCGTNALGLAYSQKPTARTNVDDYELNHGVAIEMIDGFGKIAYLGKQAGCVTIFAASAAD